MRHAYLIIAHNEFWVLRKLLSALDDVRNDIYVHIDRKVKDVPELSTHYSSLFVLEDRMDVRWGNISQIACEYLLWEKAKANGPYQYYHLISGTHLPLKNQDEIHAFFDDRLGQSMFSHLVRREGDYQEMLKLHRYSFFTRYYSSSKSWLAKLSQFMWKSCIAVQRWLKISTNDDVQFYWANNWCSLTQDAVEYLLENKERIMRRYRWSFCGDEWFAPTELMNSVLRGSVENSDVLLFGSIQKSNAIVLSMDCFESMVGSGCLFARKFSEENKDVVERISNMIIQ